MGKRFSIYLLLLCSLAFARGAFATGETVNGFPNWQERVIHELMNRARVAPNTDLAGCGANCSAAEYPGPCYGAVAPLPLTFGLQKSSRFHSASMGLNAFFDHPTPFIVRSDINSVYPTSCNGAASCASSGAGSTDPFVRISYFGVSGTGEIIAAGYSDAYSAFYGWLWENGGGAGCTFTSNNGHRYEILTGGPGVGVGYANVPGSPWTNYYTGDFGTGGTIAKVPSGSHWGSSDHQRQSSSIDFWANWYDSAAPRQATVVVDGSSHALALGRGSSTNGAWTATLTGLGAGCHRYFYAFTDSNGALVRYPTTGSLGIGDSTCADWSGSKAFADFDDNGKSDIAIWHPVTGEWWITSQPAPVTWGAAGDTPVAGDYNGDGKTEIAIWHPLTGEWWITSKSAPVTWGASGDTPVPADYDGDGKTDIAIWHPATGQWWITSKPAPVTWGAAGDVPVPADYDGDGKADIAIWHPATGQWWITSKPAPVTWGSNGDTPVPADYDGDGKADIAIWHPADGSWWITSMSAPVYWGQAGDIPVPADYDGDGKADIAVFRPSTGQWWIRGSASVVTWGQSGDVPATQAPHP